MDASILESMGVHPTQIFVNIYKYSKTYLNQYFKNILIYVEIFSSDGETRLDAGVLESMAMHPTKNLNLGFPNIPKRLLIDISQILF